MTLTITNFMGRGKLKRYHWFSSYSWFFNVSIKPQRWHFPSFFFFSTIRPLYIYFSTMISFLLHSSLRFWVLFARPSPFIFDSSYFFFLSFWCDGLTHFVQLGFLKLLFCPSKIYFTGEIIGLFFFQCVFS